MTDETGSADAGNLETGALALLNAETPQDTTPATAASDDVKVVTDAEREAFVLTLPEDQRALAKTKGWASMEDVFKSYTNAEKLIGGEKVPLPKGPDDKEGYERLYKALGRPDAPEGYQIPVPTGADGEFAKTASAWFHEAGLSPAQANAIAEKFNSFSAAAQAAADKAFQVKSGQEAGELKTEWGDKFAPNMEFAKRAVKQFGIGDDDVALMERALGTKKMMGLLQKIGSGLAEDTFERGDGKSSFRMAPAAARQRIAALKADKGWSERYLKGDADARKEFTLLQEASAAS